MNQQQTSDHSMQSKQRGIRSALRTAAEWDAAETSTRRWLNEFCENWLFALLAAFAFVTLYSTLSNSLDLDGTGADW